MQWGIVLSGAAVAGKKVNCADGKDIKLNVLQAVFSRKGLPQWGTGTHICSDLSEIWM